MDDCDERVEHCTADPRSRDCGPSCDSGGICIPNVDVCGWEAKYKCRPGLECFISSWSCPAGYRGEGNKDCGGYCLPMRFASDAYAKTRLEEISRTDLDGRQGEEDDP